MRLNTLKPIDGTKRKKTRCGRGGGCGLGKTCGRGHKGQTARGGYSKKLGFEGGQTPFQRRVPKFGFKSLLSQLRAEVRLGELQKIVSDGRVGIKELREAGIVKSGVKRVKVILSGKLSKAVVLYGIDVTKGARKAIEAAGGRIEE